MKQVFIRSSHYYYCEKTICMRCTVTRLVRESVVLCPLSLFVCEGIRVITQKSSKQNHKNNSCTQFAHRMLVFGPLTIPTKKKRKLFTTKLSQTILRNHLGFITTSAINIKLCFMQRQG